MYRLCEGKLAKSRLPEGKGTIVRQCLTQEQMCKGKYKGSMPKSSSGNCGWGKVFWMTNLEKCKIANLIQESKRKFGLVVRLIDIKYYEKLLCYLSSYINFLISDL